MITYETIDGSVISAAVWSETHVSGSSSGGHVDQYGISAPRLHVSSSTADKQQIFVKADDGQEIEITSSYWSVGFRPESKIRLVYANDFLAGLKNLDTGQYERIGDKLIITRYKPKKLIKKSLLGRILKLLFWLWIILLGASLYVLLETNAVNVYAPDQYQLPLANFIEKYYVTDPIAHSTFLWSLIIGLVTIIFFSRKRRKKGLKQISSSIEQRLQFGSTKVKGPTVTGGRKA